MYQVNDHWNGYIVNQKSVNVNQSFGKKSLCLHIQYHTDRAFIENMIPTTMFMYHYGQC